MKRICYVTIIISILLVSFLGITYSFEYSKNDTLKFELLGSDLVYLDVYSDYVEDGIKVYNNGIDVSKDVIIENMVDNTKLGEYQVKYRYMDEYIYRKVLVVDREKPEISLIGGEEIYILLGGNYQEAGYIVSDNYDDNSSLNVVIDGNVDVSNEGRYILEYTVSDSSGNKTIVRRIIYVKKAVISTENNNGTRVSSGLYNVSLYSNTITSNKFTDIGINYAGYVKNAGLEYTIILKKRNSRLEYTYNMSSSKKNYYSGEIDLTRIINGIYDLYIVSLNEEKLMNKLDIYTRILRAKVGNKLITLSYENDYVSMEVEDFDYKYDFVIDPGHGGSDIGASNGLVLEKNLNLIVSKYEKCRYESMGYRVYMVRYDDSLGEMLGTKEMDILDRRALTIGYYGAVSKIVYSNHHNGSADTSENGFEILVQANKTKDELSTEYKIFERFKKFYKVSDDVVRLYSKDYDNSKILNKMNGEVYNNRNFYSVLRIPYELYNVKNVIYEPIYMTNANDFNWYYASKNYIFVSEIKIKEYVNSIGGKYKSDNSKCL